MSTRFAELKLSKPLLANVAAEGYEIATPVQAQAIPPILAGRDVLGSAQTGTGKTAAFSLPMLQRLAENAPKGRRTLRGLILCPTRELANQIADSLRVYGRGLNLRHQVIYGGVNQNPQVRALRDGVDILVATPGRLIDLMEQGYVDLSRVEILVLDEADRMLDMGFIPAIRRIAKMLPTKRQTLLFSATIPPTIRKLVAELMNKPERVDIATKTSSADKIEQSVYFVEKKNKPILLAHLAETHGINCGIVFSRTKHGADKIVRKLNAAGIHAAAIHGNKSQNNRERALDGFRRGKYRLLVATDVAARGIDVDRITHVVNYDLTHEPETYVHRIGRTGRAGASGQAVSFCDRDEVGNLRAIQKLIRQQLRVVDEHPDYGVIASRGGQDDEDRRPAARSATRPPARSTHPLASRGESGSAPQGRTKPFRGRGKPGGKPGGKPAGKFGGRRRPAAARA